MAAKSGRGWQALMERSRDKVEELRAEMAQVVQYVGVDISDFRRIVNQVQKGERGSAAAKKEMVEPTCGWSSRSRRSTRTAACNSLILFRKATSAR